MKNINYLLILKCTSLSIQNPDRYDTMGFQQLLTPFINIFSSIIRDKVFDIILSCLIFNSDVKFLNNVEYVIFISKKGDPQVLRVLVDNCYVISLILSDST